MIRLKRVGRKNDPSYRVVLIDSHKGPKSGKINEVLGFYDPRRDVRDIKGERVKEWMSKGAQVSPTVHNILVTEKIIEGKKINVLPRKSPVVKDSESKEEVPAKAEATPEAETPSKNAPEAEAAEVKEEESKPETNAPPAPPADKPSDSDSESPGDLKNDSSDSADSVKEETK